MPEIGSVGIKPYWKTTDGETVRMYLGDVKDVLRRLPSGFVHMSVTSPPYWGLRDYGTGIWEGGKDGCDHIELKGSTRGGRYSTITGGQDLSPHKSQYKIRCNKCGAKRVDQQLGSEPSPDCGTLGQAQCGQCFVCNLVGVFREVRRVLRDEGTLWLNLGDTFLSGGNLAGIPWRVALALQADGWILRQDIIWAKLSPMPESIRNRCTKSHEYVFLLAKGRGYYCDMEAIKTAAEPCIRIVSGKCGSYAQAIAKGVNPSGNGKLESVMQTGNKANKRSVWYMEDYTALVQYLGDYHPEVLEDFLRERYKGDVWRLASQGYPGAHFATYPPKLIEPCILAGTSEYGCCGDCGAPYKRIVESKQLRRDRPNEYVKRTGVEGTGSSCANTVAGVKTKTVGWEPTCPCGTDEVVPCTVLDPFCGSGTTQEVSIEHGRRSVGVDLSEEYLKSNAIPRIEGVLYRRPSTAGLVPRNK